MTQYNTLNVNFPNFQLKKIKLGIKNGTQLTLNLSSNVFGASNNESNILHKFLSTNTQVSKLRKTLQMVYFS